jgi:hypothetical protein
VRPRAKRTLILALAAGLAAGCGSDDEQEGDPIPRQAAVDLEARLDEVERRMDAGGGACADIQNDTLPAVNSIVASLPEDVDADVRDSLEQSFQRLFDLTEEQCDEQKGQEPAPAPEPEPLPPVETVTETTETTPPEDEGDDGNEGDEEEPPAGEPTTPEPQPEPDAPSGGGEPSGQSDGGGALVPGEGE